MFFIPNSTGAISGKRPAHAVHQQTRGQGNARRTAQASPRSQIAESRAGILAGSRVGISAGSRAGTSAGTRGTNRGGVARSRGGGVSSGPLIRTIMSEAAILDGESLGCCRKSLFIAVSFSSVQFPFMFELSLSFIHRPLTT